MAKNLIQNARYSYVISNDALAGDFAEGVRYNLMAQDDVYVTAPYVRTLKRDDGQCSGDAQNSWAASTYLK